MGLLGSIKQESLLSLTDSILVAIHLHHVYPLESPGQETSSLARCLCQPSRQSCNADKTQIQLFLLRGVNALGGTQWRGGAESRHGRGRVGLW